MKRFSIFCVLCVCALSSCSSFTVNSAMDNIKTIAPGSKWGLVVRSSSRGRATREEYSESINKWLAGYKPLAAVTPLVSAARPVHEYDLPEQRFYQLSPDKDFLMYKSLGIIKTWVRDNNTELKRLISENSLDGLIVYEVYSVMSPELQFYQFNSCVVFLDSELEVQAFDHQHDTFTAGDFLERAVKLEMLDSVSKRLVELFLKRNMIEEI